MALIVSGAAVDATAAEINKLDGCAADATELGYCDGVTSAIQTQLDAIQHSHPGSASGGNETGTEGDYSWARFTANGNFVVSDGTLSDAEILIVGAGGAGGYQLSGGGGGGAVLYRNDLDIGPGTYAIVIGATHTYAAGTTQADSTIFDNGNTNGLLAVATGGGRGGNMFSDGQDGANGGGGGYSSGGIGTGTAPTASGYTIYAGHDGGAAPASSGWKPAAGGAGSNQAGTSPNTTSSPHGGNGIQLSLRDGTNYYWGGGGGGQVHDAGTAGNGGLGGGAGGSGHSGGGGTGGGTAKNSGGNGGSGHNATGGHAGANTGGGGGGGPTDTGGRGNGGSGIVIIAWTTP